MPALPVTHLVHDSQGLARQLEPIFKSEGLEGVARHLALVDEDDMVLLDILFENEGLEGIALAHLRGELPEFGIKQAGTYLGSTRRQPCSASRGASSTSPSPSPAGGGLPMSGQGSARVQHTGEIVLHSVYDTSLGEVGHPEEDVA